MISLQIFSSDGCADPAPGSGGWKLLLGSGLDLALDNECCCCDISCLTNYQADFYGSPDLPCPEGTCYISYSGFASSYPSGACWDGGYQVYLAEITNHPIQKINPIKPFLGGDWKEGYPAKFRESQRGFCIFWFYYQGTNYGIDTCETEYWEPILGSGTTVCCLKNHSINQIYKLECATQELVNVTAESVQTDSAESATYYPPSLGWSEVAVGSWVQCYSQTPTGIKYGTCECCTALDNTIETLYGPPTLICAP